MALTKTQVSELYVSIFGRASEGEGNTYWQTNQVDQVTTAKVMLETDAAKEYFGDTLDDDQAFIEFIYENTLGKTYAEDADGVDYWVAELAAGKTKAEVVSALINAATASENAGAAQMQFNNKVAVSDYTADTLDKFTSFAAFSAFIDDVDETADSVTAAKAKADAAVPADDDDDDADDIQGGTYQLTDSNVGTGAADNILGTAGDDTISGATSTLESVDVVNGAGGNDTLTARLDGTANLAPVISNVETIDLITRGNGSLNFADITGYTSVSLSGTNSYELTALPNNFEVTLKNIDDENMTLTLDNVAGTADGLTVNLDNVTGTAQLTNVQDLETLAIVSGGDSANELHASLTGFDATNGKMTVSGTQDLELDFVNNGGPATNGSVSGLTLDATALTGTFTVALEDANTNNVSKFTGVDVYEFHVGAGAAYEVDNAEDDAAISAILATDAATLTVNYDQDGAEAISSKTDTVAVTLTTDDTAGEDDFTFNLATNKIETMTLTANGITDSDSTLAVNITDGDVKSLTVDGTSLATVDSLALGGTAFSAGKLAAFDASAAATDVTAAIVTSAPASTPISISSGSGDDTLSLNSTSNTSAEFSTGAGDDTITIVGGTGDIEIEAGSGDDNITAGAGDDQIEGGSGADTISAGAGADSIDGGAGFDSLIGNAGTVETFVFADGDTGVNGVSAAANAAAALLLTDTITAFDAAADLLDISGLDNVDATSTVNDQSNVGNAHVATGLGDILVTQGQTAADAIVWINTDGAATAAFTDFEEAIYLTGVAAGGYSTADFVLV